MAKGRETRGKKEKDAAAAPPPVAPQAARPGQAAEPAPGAGGEKRARGFLAVPLAILLLVAMALAGYATRAQWAPYLARKAPPTAPAPIAQAHKPLQKDTAAKPAIEPALAGKPPAAPEAGKSAADGPTLEQLKKERNQLRADLDRVMARLETVEQAVDTAKNMARAMESPADKLQAGQAIPQLTQRLAALERSDSSLKALQKRVERMEKDASGAAQALVLAVAALNEAIVKGEPYAKPLEGLAAIAKDDPNVKAAAALLARHAKTGVPTLAVLRARFDAIAGRIVQASRTADDSGWMARAADRIASLVTWRRVGDNAKPDTVDALVARAETLLKAGDLAGAVKALNDLAGERKASAVAGPWLADAKARLAAERAVASLHLHALSLLASAKQ